ncbi:MAG: type II toxin-antitoxin system HicB family antitoxin [Coriobacteriaceae bacterium]|nr:type II toxin-antitoxin system HicB family antitoxin [Coriobacteriaceae bacterium]
MRYLYEAVLTPNELGGFDVEFPDLDIVTLGDDVEDAANMAADLLQNWIIAALQRNQELPNPVMGRRAPKNGYVFVVVVDCEEDAPEVETMTAEEAAEVLDVSRSRIYAMVRDGILHATKVGNSVLIDTESVKKRFNEPQAVGRPKKTALV